MRYERKKEIEDDFKGFGLNKWIDSSVVIEIGGIGRDVYFKRR